jgi:hypothetical protein
MKYDERISFGKSKIVRNLLNYHCKTVFSFQIALKNRLITFGFVLKKSKLCGNQTIFSE